MYYAYAELRCYVNWLFIRMHVLTPIQTSHVPCDDVVALCVAVWPPFPSFLSYAILTRLYVLIFSFFVVVVNFIIFISFVCHISAQKFNGTDFLLFFSFRFNRFD